MMNIETVGLRWRALSGEATASEERGGPYTTDQKLATRERSFHDVPPGGS
jgi:hypothetical protein